MSSVAVQEIGLRCHTTSSCIAIDDIRATVQRLSATQLQLNYRALGELGKIRVPSVVKPERRDELWQHTCAELFVAELGKESYVEFNLSPSTCWAAYQFSAYRQGMRAATDEAPEIAVVQDGTTLSIDARVTLPAHFAATEKLQLSMTMVIEDIVGRFSYWAVQHAAAKPDFHCRQSFVVAI